MLYWCVPVKIAFPTVQPFLEMLFLFIGEVLNLSKSELLRDLCWIPHIVTKFFFTWNSENRFMSKKSGKFRETTLAEKPVESIESTLVYVNNRSF